MNVTKKASNFHLWQALTRIGLEFLVENDYKSNGDLID